MDPNNTTLPNQTAPIEGGLPPLPTTPVSVPMPEPQTTAAPVAEAPSLPPLPVTPLPTVQTVPQVPEVVAPISGGVKPKKKIDPKVLIGGVVAIVLMVGAIVVSRLLPSFQGELRQRAGYACTGVCLSSCTTGFTQAAGECLEAGKTCCQVTSYARCAAGSELTCAGKAAGDACDFLGFNGTCNGAPNCVCEGFQSCGSGLSCTSSAVSGAGRCADPSTHNIQYCCGSGQVIVNGACTSGTPCGTGLSCNDSHPTGSTSCIQSPSGHQTYCCPSGSTIVNGACVAPNCSSNSALGCADKAAGAACSISGQPGTCTKTPGGDSCSCELTQTCGTGLSCNGSHPSGSTQCTQPNGNVTYCCSSGQTIVNNVCTSGPYCSIAKIIACATQLATCTPSTTGGTCTTVPVVTPTPYCSILLTNCPTGQTCQPSLSGGSCVINAQIPNCNSATNCQASGKVCQPSISGGTCVTPTGTPYCASVLNCAALGKVCIPTLSGGVCGSATPNTSYCSPSIIPCPAGKDCVPSTSGGSCQIVITPRPTPLATIPPTSGCTGCGGNNQSCCAPQNGCESICNNGLYCHTELGYKCTSSPLVCGSATVGASGQCAVYKCGNHCNLGDQCTELTSTGPCSSASLGGECGQIDYLDTNGSYCGVKSQTCLQARCNPGTSTSTTTTTSGGCPFNSTQGQVQRDAAHQWADAIPSATDANPILPGSSFRIGGFHNGTGTLATGMTATVWSGATQITTGLVSNGDGSWTFSVPANQAAGTLTVKVTTNGQTGANCQDQATVTIGTATTAEACMATRLYTQNTSGQWVETAPADIASKVGIGGVVRMAVRGNKATFLRGRFIIKKDGVTLLTQETTNSTNLPGDPATKEYYYDYTIPSGGTYAIEGYVSLIGSATSTSSSSSSTASSITTVSDFMQVPASDTVTGKPKQTFLSADGTKIYDRFYDNGAWQAWTTTPVTDLQISGVSVVRAVSQSHTPANVIKYEALSTDGKTLYTRLYQNNAWQAWTTTAVSSFGISGVDTAASFNQGLDVTGNMVQTVTSADGTNLYYRIYSNNAWGAWQTVVVASMPGLPSGVTAVRSFQRSVSPVNNIQKQEMVSTDGKTIYTRLYQNNAWGSFTTTGVSSLLIGGTDTTLLPMLTQTQAQNISKVSDFMQVPAADTVTGKPKQTFLSADGTKIYDRFYDNGAWGAWTTTPVTDLQISGVSAVRAVSQSHTPANVIKYEALSTDGKTLYTRLYQNNAWQAWTTTAVSGFGITGVDTVASFNQGLDVNGTLVQTVTSADGANLYYRVYSNNAWGAWQTLLVNNIPGMSALSNAVRSFQRSVSPVNNQQKQEMVSIDGTKIYTRFNENNTWMSFTTTNVSSLSIPGSDTTLLPMLATVPVQATTQATCTSLQAFGPSGNELADDAAVEVNTQVTYQINYKNNSNSTLSGVSVADAFPQGLTPNSDTCVSHASALNSQRNGYDYICNVPNLAPGATASVRITGTMTTALPMTNSVWVNQTVGQACNKRIYVLAAP